jgi:hypothetical protein
MYTWVNNWSCRQHRTYRDGFRTAYPETATRIGVHLLLKMSSLRILYKEWMVQWHCAYFFIYDWPWPRYLGNEIKLVRCGPSLITDCRARKFDRGSRFLQQRHLTLGPPVHILVSWRYRPCIFMWEDGLRKLLKFNQGTFSRRPPLYVLCPVWRAHIFWSGMFRFTGHCHDEWLEYRMWISWVHVIDSEVLFNDAVQSADILKLNWQDGQMVTKAWKEDSVACLKVDLPSVSWRKQANPRKFSVTDS